MSVTVQLDTTKLNDRIFELREALMGQGADVSTIFEDESRLFLKQVIRLTPPKTKKQGEEAIKKDLGKIFTAVNGDLLDDLIIEHGHSIDAWLTTAGGEKKHLDWRYADNTGGPMADFHHRNLNERGRTYNRKQQRGDKWYAPYVVSFETMADYRKKIQARVGRKKAAWGKSFIALGGKLPSWIARHLGGAKGEYHNDRNLEKPSITMISRAPGVGQDEHFVRGALRVRESAIKRRIKLVLSGYSKDVARGMKIQRQAHKTPESFQEAS